jgi:hypothetical protein
VAVSNVQIPGVGSVPRKYAIAGAGGAAVFVLWRYQRATKKAQAAKDAAATVSVDPATGLPLDPVTGLPYDPSTGLVMTGGGNLGDQYSVPGGSGSSSTSYAGPTIPQNNLQWTQDATTYLTGLGYEQTAVAGALGAYLNRATLTTTQVTIVQAATAAVGPPPYGGPYSLTPTPSTTAPVMPPGGLVVTERGQDYIALMWSASDSPNIASYHIKETSPIGASDQDTTGTSYTKRQLVPGIVHTFTVYAVNKSGQRSPGVSVIGQTLAAGAAPVHSTS